MPGRLEPEPIPRRDVLGIAGLWSAGIAIVGTLVGMARLPKPRVLPEATLKVRVGKADEFKPGTTRLFPESNVLVTCSDEGIKAMSMICTHLGCIVKEKDDGDGFICPCHGSRFDSTGKVIGGPAPSPLWWLAVSQAADGNVIVDKGRRVDPGTFVKLA